MKTTDRTNCVKRFPGVIYEIIFGVSQIEMFLARTACLLNTHESETPDCDKFSNIFYNKEEFFGHSRPCYSLLVLLSKQTTAVLFCFNI